MGTREDSSLGEGNLVRAVGFYRETQPIHGKLLEEKELGKNFHDILPHSPTYFLLVSFNG